MKIYRNCEPCQVFFGFIAGRGLWIPRPAFQTRRYYLALAGYHPALSGTPPEEGNWNYLGGLFQMPLYPLGGLFSTPLYRLCPCRRVHK